MTKPIIGLLHSTRFTDDQRAAFVQGLTEHGWPPDKVELRNQGVDTEGHYGRGHDDLKNEATDHYRNHVDVIVTAGGLVSALAASKALTELRVAKPIVFLIGRRPSQAGEEGYDEFRTDRNLAGGVELGTTIANDARRDALIQQFGTSLGVQAASIGLMVNTNSSMWQGELGEWRQFGQQLSFQYPNLLVPPTTENDASRFADFFQQIASSADRPSAIVVSADPFFFRARSLLMKGAGSVSGLDVPLCFPFEEYRNTPEFDPSRHVVVGNRLLDGYIKLGTKAAEILTRIFPRSIGIDLLPRPDVKSRGD